MKLAAMYPGLLHAGLGGPRSVNMGSVTAIKCRSRVLQGAEKRVVSVHLRLPSQRETIAGKAVNGCVVGVSVHKALCRLPQIAHGWGSGVAARPESPSTIA